MPMHVGASIWKQLRGQKGSTNALRDLVEAFDKGEALKPSRLKRSGDAKSATFEGYKILRLWHAKLDPYNTNKGNPLLVLQQNANGDLIGVALANHENYATSDHAVCRRWIWENRDELDWDLTQERRELRQALDLEFGDGQPTPRRR